MVNFKLSSKHLFLDVYSHTDLTQEKRVINTLDSLRFNFFTVMKYKFKSILKRLKSL